MSLQPPLPRGRKLRRARERGFRLAEARHRRLQPHRRIEDGIRNAPAQIRLGAHVEDARVDGLLAVSREAEVRDRLGAVQVHLPIVGPVLAAVVQRVEEDDGTGLGGPAFEDDAVAQQAYVAVLPGVGDRFHVVGVVVDVADFGIAFGVRGGEGGDLGE